MDKLKFKSSIGLKKYLTDKYPNDFTNESLEVIQLSSGYIKIIFTFESKQLFIYTINKPVLYCVGVDDLELFEIYLDECKLKQ